MRNYYEYLLKFKNPYWPFPYAPPSFNTFHNNIFDKEPFWEDNFHSDDYLQQIEQPQSFNYNNHQKLLSPKDINIHPYSYSKIIPRDQKMFNPFVKNEIFDDSIDYECGNFNTKGVFYNQNIFEKTKKNEEDNFDNKGFVVIYQDNEDTNKEDVAKKKMDMSFDDENIKDLSLEDFFQQTNNQFNNYNIFHTYPNNVNHSPMFNNYNQMRNYNEEQFQQFVSKIDNNEFNVYNNFIDRNKEFNNLTHNYQYPAKIFSPITPISHPSLSLRHLSPFIRKKRTRNNYIDPNLSFLNTIKNFTTHCKSKYFLFKPASINIFDIYSTKQESIYSLSHIQNANFLNIDDINQTAIKLHQSNNSSTVESPHLLNNLSSLNNYIVTNTTNNFTSTTMNTFGNDTNQLDLLSYEEKCDSKTNENRKKKRRKYKPDDIRKKIKARFHKILKNKTNKLLENAGSKILFDFLPQSFICNISKNKNKEMMQLTYSELLKKDFAKELNPEKYKKTQVDKAKCFNNQEVLKYLERHKDIKVKSGFDVIGNLLYIQILKEYFKSEDFVETVKKLEGKEDAIYIKEYVINANGYIDFFLESKL